MVGVGWGNAGMKYVELVQLPRATDVDSKSSAGEGG